MKRLYNQTDAKVLKDALLKSQEQRITLSFYQYYQIGNPDFFRDYLYLHFDEVKVLGRIYVANEGVNAQISLPAENYDSFCAKLDDIDFLASIRLNIAIEDDGKSFFKLKIKVRNKIVADGLNDDSFDVTDRGRHLSAEEFNKLTDQEKTILVDMRNHYEHEVGHFDGAILPDADTFREELPLVIDMLQDKKDQNIVMYCTGGIRCEKASAWLKHNGFENVHQLEGGIIEYARQVEKKQLQNKFKGKNFVFDDRRGEKISNDIIAQCHQCGAPADTHTNCENEACHLLFIQCESCKVKFENCCSADCQSVIKLPEDEQKALRKGNQRSNKIFKKGRTEHIKNNL